MKPGEGNIKELLNDIRFFRVPPEEDPEDENTRPAENFRFGLVPVPNRKPLDKMMEYLQNDTYSEPKTDVLTELAKKLNDTTKKLKVVPGADFETILLGVVQDEINAKDLPSRKTGTYGFIIANFTFLKNRLTIGVKL